MEEAIENLRIPIEESRAQITSAVLPTVLADQTHVCQLFQNLIANAIKYARPSTPPQIDIFAAQNGEHSVIGIRDNGQGIEPEHQERIFLPFKRLHGPEIAGAGIGLATCKRIVERYNGRIWVASKVGEGSTFYFSLPAAEGRANVA